MKNREEAEARANELWPSGQSNAYNIYNFEKRKAFLQCYDEMSKYLQKEALIELTEMGDYAKGETQKVKLEATYTEADLVSFGNYLGHEVTHADLENWKNERK